MDSGGMVTVCYNGSCPVCRTEIEHYRRIAGDAPLEWVDVAADPGAARALGVAGDDAFRRLHTVGTDGEVVGGVDAFVAIWRRLPRYGWLARLAQSRALRPVADFVYERLLVPPLYWAHRRRQKRAAARSGTSDRAAL